MNIDDYVFVLFALIFCHLVADFLLQGCLAKMKQKAWWNAEIESSIKDSHELQWARRYYRHDYISALLAHGFIWACITFAPLLPLMHISKGAFCVIVAVNAIVHAGVDDLKANEHLINLNTDQFFHYVQIAFAVVWVSSLR